MLHEVADGVWVRQGEWVWSNAVVVRGDGGSIQVDPSLSSWWASSSRCRRTADPCRARSSSIRRTPSGHGAAARGPEVAAHVAADRAYIDALRRGEEPADPRLGQDWLAGPHQSDLERARQSSG